jgi:steroid delta-isomerase
MRSLTRASISTIALLAAALAAQADMGPTEDVALIRTTLERWTDDFNNKRSDKVCDLFARDTIADFRGQPERGYDEICQLLQQSLTDQAKTFTYALEIKEVIVAGDLAAVRLEWTLQIAPLNVTSVEPGMDIFRRDADGKWRILRYLAYEAP